MTVSVPAPLERGHVIKVPETGTYNRHMLQEAGEPVTFSTRFSGSSFGELLLACSLEK